MYFGKFLLLLVTGTTIDAYNILAIFPTPSISHQQTCLGFSRALAEKGHNVTVITTDPGYYDPLPNHHEIDASIMYEIFEDFKKSNNFSLQTTVSAFRTLPTFPKLSALCIEVFFKSEAGQKLMRSTDTKFDLILYEGIYPSALGLVHHFDYPPSVVLFTVPKYIPLQWSVGNTINPSYSSSFVTEYSDKMSFFERIINTFYVFYEIYAQNYYAYPFHDEAMRKIFGDNLPSIKDMERNNSLLILSGDLTQDYPTPMQPNTIQIGTIHITDKKPLPQDTKKWMDEAEKGVIYFSLGSNVKGTSVPEHKINIFSKVFQQFPKYRVIWKWESDEEFLGKPENVMLKKWLPQQTILAHPKMRLFITQGGQQSRQEAIHFGVPVLTVPMFWDQGWNGKKMEDAGAGLMLGFYDITYETLYEKLKALLTDYRFKKNMQKLSEISKDKPMSNADTAVWWIEYVIRHKGAPHLRPAVQDLYWYQYTLIDVFAFIFSIVFAFLYFIYLIVNKFLRSSPNEIKLKKH